MAKEINQKTENKIHKKRNDFIDYLQKNSASTRPGTHAVHMLKYGKEKYPIKSEDYANSWFAAHCRIAFSQFPSLTEKEFDYIISTIQEYKF